ncbi:PspA/IM30 family protein [Calothrix sp. CCY 0018]|uniref:PspA/IM30 family protein n=1 Tax=Calothrix sp. CCY 0018 TaxID=3103864 RepID=UPI0039C6E592
MGLMERIGRLFRSNVNSWTAQREDPEKILEQAVYEMQENLVQMRQGVAQAIATQKRTERQAAQAHSTEDEWYRRAQMALEQGNDALAREALTKRKAYQQTSTALASQIGQQKTLVAKLKKDMQALELKISEAKTKKDMYIARARSAEASLRLQEMLGETGDTSSLKAFEKMEDKLLELEAKQEAIAASDTDELENKFASLSESDDVDAELSAMRAQLPISTQKYQQPPQ